MKSTKPFKHRVCSLLFWWLLVALKVTGQNPEPQAGLIAHYPLTAKHWNKTSSVSEQYMELNAYDVSGNGHHGTYTSSNYTYGSFKGELTPFDEAALTINGHTIPCTEKIGSDNYYLAIPDLSLSFSNFSVAFWIYSSDEGTSGGVMHLPFIEIVNAGRSISVSSGSNTIFKQVYNSEGWNYIAITVNNGSVTIYNYTINAPNFAVTSPPESTSSTYTLNISNDNQPYYLFKTSGRSFTGKLSQVKFFNKTLTQTEVNENLQIDVNWVQRIYSNKHYPYSGVYSFYPFNAGAQQFNDVAKGNNNGTKIGNITTVQGHDGTNNAIQLSGNGTRIQLNNFFGNSYDLKKGFTFSFWTKITEANQPFSTVDPSTASGKTIFYKYNGYRNILGMQRLNELLSSFRFSPKSKKNLDLWYNEPISFTNQSGWYHVTLSCHPEYSEIYIKKPQADPLTGEILNKYVVYFGANDQEWLNATFSYGIGSPTGNDTPIDYLDDFRIYNWPLDEEEVIALNATTIQQSAEQLAENNWQTTSVSNGLNLKKYSSDDLFGGKQRIHLLDIDLTNANLEMKMNYDMPFYDPTHPHTFNYCTDYLNGLHQLKPVSQLAAQVGALAAVNGTFFSWYKSGQKGWQQYVKKDGLPIWTPDIMSQKNEGAVAFDFNRPTPADKVKFFARDKDNLNIYTQSNSTLNQYANVISGGHYMQQNHYYQLQVPAICGNTTIPAGDCTYDASQYSTNLNCTTTNYNYMSCIDYCRAPLFLQDQAARTFIGRKGTHLILGTFNGKKSNPDNTRAGISIHDMRLFKDAYGLDDYLTLDGGSSTTMWVNGQGVLVGNGFDYGIEAPIANILLIKPKVQTTQITDEPVATSTKAIHLNGSNFVDLSKYYDQIAGFQNGILMGRFNVAALPAAGQEYTIFSVSHDTTIANYEYTKLALVNNGGNLQLHWLAKQAGKVVTEVYSDAVNLVAKEWHSFALIINDNQGHLYLDHFGKPFSGDHFTPSIATHAHLGTYISNGQFQHHFNGDLDEVVLYTDLTALHNALQKHPTIKTYQNLVNHFTATGIVPTALLIKGSHYWQFEENADYHAIDVAGERYRGTAPKGETGFHGLLVNQPQRVSTGAATTLPAAALKAHSVHIYPNPSHGSFVLALTLDKPSDIHLQFYDVTGKVVYTEQRIGEPGEQQWFFDRLTAKGLAAGAYIVVVTTEEWTTRKKIVIE